MPNMARTRASVLSARVFEWRQKLPQARGQGHEVPAANGILADRRRVAAAVVALAAHRVGVASQYRRSGLGGERRRLRHAPVLRPSARRLRGGLPGADRLRSESPGGSQNALRLPHRAFRRTAGHRGHRANRREAAATYAVATRPCRALAWIAGAQGGGGKAPRLTPQASGLTPRDLAFDPGPGHPIPVARTPFSGTAASTVPP